MKDSKDKIPPGATFYIRMCNYNSDDTMSLTGESMEGGLKIKDALWLTLRLRVDAMAYGGMRGLVIKPQAREEV